MKTGIHYIGVSVGAMIFNKKKEVFLSKRSKKVTNERGTWEFPGGKVHFGETLQEAIIREMNEEYGVDLILDYQLPAQNHFIPEEKQHWVPSCFIARCKNAQEPRIMEPEKCDAIGWFQLDNLPKPLSIITKLDLIAYETYKKNKL